MCMCAQAVRLFAPLWTEVLQAFLSMEFSRQQSWSRLPFPTPGGLPNPEIKAVSLVYPALTSRLFTARTIWEAPSLLCQVLI